MVLKEILRMLGWGYRPFAFDKGGSPPPAPPAPDPAVQIAAEAKVNRYNVRSPFGSQTWTPPRSSVPSAPMLPGPASPSGGRWVEQGGGEGMVPQWESDAPTSAPGGSTGGSTSGGEFDNPWTQTIALDPSQQRQFDSRNAIAEQMLGRANTQMGQFSSSPFSFDPSGGGSRAALDRMGRASPSFTQSAGTFNPSVRDMGTFNPSTDDATSRELVARLRSFSDSPWDANVDGSAVQRAVYDKARLNLDPTYGRMQEQLDQKLVNQGLPIGSEAYGQANDVFGRERSNAYNTASLDSIIQGANEEQNQFGRALSTRQQNVGDVATALGGAQSQAGQEFGRTMAVRGQQTGEREADYSRDLRTRGQQAAEFGDDFSRTQNRDQAAFAGEMAMDQDGRTRALSQRQQQYNELAALLGGQQLNPLNPSGGQIDVGGAFQNQQVGLNRQYQGELAGYNAGVAGQNSTMGGLFSLGAAALPLAFSDRRLKRDIARVGEVAPGVGWYAFSYLWDERGARPHYGVMADEVEPFMPEAVLYHASGFAMVDYGRLLAGRTVH